MNIVITIADRFSVMVLMLTFTNNHANNGMTIHN
jgi:hypothetical protein